MGCRLYRHDGFCDVVKTVYLIDDDAAVRKALALVLRSVRLDAVTFASAEAFLAAKQEATDLAQAAELDLGMLLSLEGGAGIDADYDNDDYRAFYNSPFLSALRQQMSGRNRSGEVMGASLGLLKFRVTVNATFGYK